ncbi:MAG TPA: response regulator [Candidatus Latescibacteria bacterium]|jgi:DNA-binding NtrC family response regulator|nr:response regulator [Candidatus Latescibacterota bacterium]HJP29135.1 response regulator [Candidatus Latescibacterota bacterium]
MGKLNIDLGKVLATQGGNHAILVIDDSAIARKTLAKNLEYYGFDVFEAESGIEGLQSYLANKREIAIVILDIVLPDVPGERILAKLQELDPEVKVIVCTESASTEFKQQGQKVAGVLRKPISTDKLLRVLHLALGMSPNTEDDA